jgi:Domain of unknown function (DUF4253)
MSITKPTLASTCQSCGLDSSTLQDLSPKSSAFKIYSITVPGKDALSARQRLRDQAETTGYWPVIAGSPAEFAGRDIETLNAKLPEIATLIKESHDLSVDEWFLHAFAKLDFREQEVSAEVGIPMHAAFKEYTDNFSPAGLKRFEEIAQSHDINADGWLSGEYTCLHCPAPVVTPTSEDDLVGHKNILTNQPYERVVILLVPTKHAWEVPAFLSIGIGEPLHEPYEHAAIQKFWHEKYGAEIITSTSDTIEMFVSRPPTTNEEAIELAQQQFAYAPDIVNHGIGKTSALASQLKNGTSWYFWWD